MLRDRLGHAVEDALEVVVLLGLLYLHEDDVAVAVLGLDVDAVVLVLPVLLVALALKDFLHMHLLF